MIKLSDDWNSPMRDFLSKFNLEDQVKSIGLAPIEIPTSLSPRLPTQTNLVKLEISTLKEVQTFFQGIRDDAILKSGNTPVALYIKWSRMINSSSPIGGLPRLHLVNCSKLKEMKSAGRINRYVATSETSGLYDLLSGSNQIGFKRPLLVCQACLTSIRREHPNAAGINLSKSSNEINLASWFSLSPGSIPHSNLFSTPKMVSTGGYTQDWNRISQNKRDSAGWKCSDCKVNLTNHKYLLDTHHVDGNPQNNIDSNLAVLCRVCHSNQPMHQHMRDTSAWKSQYGIISKIRNPQRISIKLNQKNNL
jgi:hypothetical protein